MVDRWTQANTLGAYLVLKVFSGYKACASQPDGWHQYAPDGSIKSVGISSFTISPGFFKASEAQLRLARDLHQWDAAIHAMIASKADFQLITTFNEWGEGTAVEAPRSGRVLPATGSTWMRCTTMATRPCRLGCPARNLKSMDFDLKFTEEPPEFSNIYL